MASLISFSSSAALVSACSINAVNVRRNANAACVTITELADTLVRSEDLTFRQAHEISAKTARAVIAADKTLSDGFAAFAAAFEAETGHTSKLNDDTYRKVTSLEHFVAVRDRPGGPGRNAMSDALASYGVKLADLKSQASARKLRVETAASHLSSAFSKLMER